MVSHDKLNDQNEIPVKTLWLLISISLSALEILLPRMPLLPWLKPGLANIITILWIVRFGAKDAILFSFLRSWITGFYFGFSFTTFILSLSGGILSTTVMGLAWVILGKNKIIGTIGLGMIGALTHNLGQLGIIYLLMARNTFVFYQIPFMCGASLVFGAAIGACAPFFAKIIQNTTIVHTTTMQKHLCKSSDISKATIFYASIVFTFCISLVFIKSLLILITAMILVTIVTGLICGFSVKNILYPLRFWALFLFIAIVYLFFSYGTRIHGLPFITREGLDETSAQFLRLWIWLEASFLLHHFQFHTFFFKVLKWLFPSHVATFSAGLLSLEYFPEMIRFSRSKESRNGLNFMKSPINSLRIFIERIIVHIESII
jgi:heptaprenyl diphosphate synthase